MEIKEPLKVGDTIEIEIMPLEGSYKATTVEGEDFVEKFSPESAKKIVDNWIKDGKKDILCDIDHSSVDTNNTQAAGWVTNLFVDEEAKRLKGTLQVSEKGAELLNGLEFRYLSPVLFFTEDNFPYYLDSVSLTNTPRLQELKPVYNCKERKTMNNEENKEEPVEETQPEQPVEETQQETPEEPKEETENTEETSEEKQVNNNDEETLMEELKNILGLPPEATPEDVKASVQEIVGKLKAIADEEIAQEAEEAVNECGIDEDKKEEVMNCYKQNPQLVKSVLNAFKKTPAKMVANAQEAVKPELTDAEKLKREYASLKGGKDKVDFLKAHPGMKL